MKDAVENKEEYLKLAMEIYEQCMLLNPERYANKTKEQMKVEKLSIENKISKFPLKIAKKMVELALKKSKEENLTFNIDLVISRYVCAEYLVRNNMESFDELWDNPDDVVI